MKRLEELIELEDNFMAKTYDKVPVQIVAGEGVFLIDSDGKRYIDTSGQFGVGILGCRHPRVVEAITRQAAKIIHLHGSLYNDKRSEFLEKLTSITPSGLDRVFMSNSGAEAVEAGLKLAVKYTGREEIVAMEGAYHGKTVGALSVTWGEKYRMSFEALLHETKFARFGRVEELRDRVTDKTAAIIAEPIQGESGVILPRRSIEYFKEMREIADEKGALLIFDEIQSGLGRTGKMWASEHYGVVPDIMLIGKGVAGGIPMGVTAAREEIMDSLRVGEHTSTFGGNPLACAAGSAVIDELKEKNLPERAAKLGRIFGDHLDEINEKHRIVRKSRGLGLMRAIDLMLHREYMGIAKNVKYNALQKGVFLILSGPKTIRFLPPLIIEEEHLERIKEVLDLCLEIEGERMKESGIL